MIEVEEFEGESKEDGQSEEKRIVGLWILKSFIRFIKRISNVHNFQSFHITFNLTFKFDYILMNGFQT